jgi:hypothetical protein
MIAPLCSIARLIFSRCMFCHHVKVCVVGQRSLRGRADQLPTFRGVGILCCLLVCVCVCVCVHVGACVCVCACVYVCVCAILSAFLSVRLSVRPSARYLSLHHADPLIIAML